MPQLSPSAPLRFCISIPPLRRHLPPPTRKPLGNRKPLGEPPRSPHAARRHRTSSTPHVDAACRRRTSVNALLELYTPCDYSLCARKSGRNLNRRAIPLNPRQQTQARTQHHRQLGPASLSRPQSRRTAAATEPPAREGGLSLHSCTAEPPAVDSLVSFVFVYLRRSQHPPSIAGPSPPWTRRFPSFLYTSVPTPPCRLRVRARRGLASFSFLYEAPPRRLPGPSPPWARYSIPFLH